MSCRGLIHRLLRSIPCSSPSSLNLYFINTTTNLPTLNAAQFFRLHRPRPPSLSLSLARKMTTTKTPQLLHYSPLPNLHSLAGKRQFPGKSSFFPPSISFPSHHYAASSPNLSLSFLHSRASSNTSSPTKLELSRGIKDGILGLFLSGWRSRVSADPQFPFKVLMEQMVGVTSCVIGDMASRPNFGLNELDFVFSTLVVSSILNFVLMYLLAPTTMSSSVSSTLPSIFASSPTSHMFESGAYSVLNRLGTFVYKGIVFAAVGFAAGLAGTALSNGLIKMRKKMDPDFETPNKPPPTLLNAFTWALHMGLSSNFRYQTVNGIEFLLAKGLPTVVFKSSVVVLRCLNNVLGGVSFVMLARLTGSQKSGNEKTQEKTKLLEGDGDL